jgi:CRISPR/Cas system CSM-associated protein Csm3 (group 7 of RAMP superfamily)
VIEAILRITMVSDWLVSTSREGGEADLRPLLDDDGLPMIPGRSLRGLLRQATVDAAAVVGANAAQVIFGSQADEGRVAIGDARVPAGIARGVTAGRLDARDLMTIRRRTAIDPETGTALAGSLHAIETAISGLVLLAPIECRDAEDLARLALAATLVRRLGMSRSRGLGRCRLEIVREGRRLDPAAATPVGGAA